MKIIATNNKAILVHVRSSVNAKVKAAVKANRGLRTRP